jgi:hypothetical protein
MSWNNVSQSLIVEGSRSPIAVPSLPIVRPVEGAWESLRALRGVRSEWEGGVTIFISSEAASKASLRSA